MAMNLSARMGVLPLAASLLAISGCVSTTFHPAPGFEVRQGPPVSPDAVLFIRAVPSQHCIALGEIEAWVSGFPSNETARRRVREAAAAVGADAIIWRGGNLFAEEPGREEESVSPRTVSFTVTAIRCVGTPPVTPPGQP